MGSPNDRNLSNTTQEKTVRCPICGEEKLSRGIYLHVNRSVGAGHGKQGEIPEDVDLDDLEQVGEQEVQMDYPETRDVEEFGRRCPFCNEIFQGKHGVMIHISRMAGRGSHPNDTDKVNPENFTIVHVDDDGNTVYEVEDTPVLPSTRRRRMQVEKEGLEERIQSVIREFRQEGKNEAADRLEELLSEKSSK